MIKDLSQKFNDLRAEARSIMNEGNLTPEKRQKVDALLAQANEVKTDIERMESLAVSEDRNIPANAPPRDGFDAEQRSGEAKVEWREQNKRTNVALRSYLRGERFETRDLTVAADGGVMIPVAALPPVEAQHNVGNLYDIVKHLRTDTGEDVRVPLWDDTANGFVDDSTAVSTTDPIVNGETIKTGGWRANPILLDNKLIQDVAYDLVAEVNNAFNLRYARAMGQAISNNAGSFSYFTPLQGNIPAPLTTEAAGVVGYDDLVTLISTLDPAYHANACFSMSLLTLGAVRKIKTTTGLPIFEPLLQGATSGFAGTIFGYPVKLDQYAPAVATSNVAITFGDFAQGYTVREVNPGMVIKKSAERWIELNRLGVVAFARVGGSPTIASTTYSPLIGLKVQ